MVWRVYHYHWVRMFEDVLTADQSSEKVASEKKLTFRSPKNDITESQFESFMFHLGGVDHVKSPIVRP